MEDYYLFHITWVTHSSRISPRMKKFVSLEKLKPVFLTLNQEIEICSYIAEIVIKDKIKILIFNICGDHVHLILFCKDSARDNVVRKLKGKSTQFYKNKHNITDEFHLWAQKYNYWTIINDEQLERTYEYIKLNRLKHSLENSEELEKVIETMLTPYEDLFIFEGNKA